MIEKKPVADIAYEMGYMSDDVMYKVLHQYGIPTERRTGRLNPLYKEFFTDRQEQILLGGILGDGCVLAREQRHPKYTETHSVHQLEYLDWKAKEFYPFITKVQIGHQAVQGQIVSCGLPQLHFYRNLFYPEDHKVIPVECLNWLDELALAVWYMDDGSFTKTSGQVRIATCSFKVHEISMIQGWLMGKYGILSYIHINRNYPVLCIATNHNDKFFGLIEPHLIPSMRYKLGQ
jgi:recombination protein RecA